MAGSEVLTYGPEAVSLRAIHSVADPATLMLEGDQSATCRLSRRFDAEFFRKVGQLTPVAYIDIGSLG